MPDELERRIADLSPAKRELLMRRLGQRPAEGAMPSASAGGPSDLSFAQRRQWFLHVLDPMNPVFNISDASRLRGPLDIEALRGALSALVARHEILRTGYADVEGEPKQFVFDEWEYSLPIIDLPEGPAWEAELYRLVAREGGRPFDLGRDLMHRSALLRIDDHDHVLLRTTHHIASDRWSAGIVNRDLSALYAASVHGRPASLPVLPIQYADHAVRQRQQFAAGDLAEHLGYWATRLEGAPLLLDLPADRIRPTFQSNRGSVYRESLPGSLIDALRSLARRERCTLFMVLFSGFALLLGRLARQDDLLVGVPVAGRTRPDVEDLIGQFINTLVLRVDVSGKPTFRELLAQVRRTTLEGLAHQTLPFDRLVEAMKPARLPGRTPLFQVMFDYLNAPFLPLELPELTVERLPIEADASPYDLSLYVTEVSGGLQVAFEYALDLFDHSTIARFAAAYRTLLEAATEDPDRPAYALPLLTAEERKRMLADRNAGASARPVETIVTGFWQQAERNPGRPALRYLGRTVTYGELNDGATRLARTLSGRGVSKGDRVGLLFDRSPDLVTAFLAVLIAGGVAVLLDPAHPDERLLFQLSDSSAGFLISNGAVPAGYDGILIAGPAADIEAETADRGDATVTLDDPMYVVYTSGSTGRPKGILIGHRSVANFVYYAVRRYAIDRGDRILQFAAPGFDTMIEELLPGLCTGASIVVRPSDVVSFSDVARLVTDESITVLDLPTAYWSAWVSEMARREESLPAGVRLVIVGGEQASLDDWMVWRRITDGRVRWINTYGPSETTVVITTFEPSAHWPGSGGASVPIGRPIDNAHLHVVDRHFQPVPIGVPGELLVGGIPLALGYVGDAALTAERFVASPGSQNGERLYRTGDLVRWLPDGSLEYRGRLDTQVKVRGIRVEPGEIEQSLVEHPAVGAAAVVATEARPGEIILAAHIEAKGDGPPVEHLVDHLRRRLPEQMIPATFTVHKRLPWTPSGKIDRAALAAFLEGAAASRSDERPATELEERILQIWSEVLAREDLSIRDGFFDVGGHSLLAIKLMSRISDAVGWAVPLRTIFEATTVAAMARVLENGSGGDSGRALSG